MKKYLLFTSVLLVSCLHADSEVGCSISGFLELSKSSLLENSQNANCTKDEDINITIIKTGITRNLMFVNVVHEREELVIKREINEKKFICPPSCIEPMNIKDVVTVGELEVLTFIGKLKEKKARLLIDVRKNNIYKEGTIPGAINLPFSMLEDESKYQEEVLKLLGAKLEKKSSKSKWSFENVQSLLIFGSSAMSSEASSSVKKLLELGYPNSKLLYYRAGINSWKALGLTTY